MHAEMQKYVMMGGLVQKPVTAPAAEILIGTKPRKAEIDGKVHHAPLGLAIF